MSKSPESPQFFEVLRGLRRKETPAPERPAPPASQAVEAPKPAPQKPQPERTLSIKNDTAALILFSFVGALFVVFALGVRWGRQQVEAKSPPPRKEAPAPVKPNPKPDASATGTSATPAGGGSSEASARSDPRPSKTQTPVVTPAPIKNHALLLIYYIPDAEGKANAERMMDRIRREGFPAPRVSRILLRGQEYLGVLAGHFASLQDPEGIRWKAKAENLDRKLRNAEIILETSP